MIDAKKNVIQWQIGCLLQKRNKILKKDYNSDVNSYDKKIKDLLYKNKNRLSIEYILETMTKLGNSPNVLYDDNGHFCIEEEGYQNAPVKNKPEAITMTFITQKRN